MFDKLKAVKDSGQIVEVVNGAAGIVIGGFIGIVAISMVREGIANVSNGFEQADIYRAAIKNVADEIIEAAGI